MPIKSLYKTKSSLYRKAFEKKGLGNSRSYQRGGTLPPIYTSNPKDSRLRAYNDSLDVYNKSEKNWKLAQTYGRLNSYGEVYYPNEMVKHIPNIVDINTNLEPRAYKSTVDENRNFNRDFPVFKKPVQPVQYADPKIVEKQKKLKEVGLYTGRLDGVWGKKSKEAWKKYEENLSAEKTPTTPTTLTTTTTSTTPTTTSNPTSTKTSASTTTATTTVPTAPPVVRKPVIYTAPTKVQPTTTQTSSDTPWRFMLGNDSYQTFDEETAKTFAKDLGITNLQRGDNKNIDPATGKYRDYSSLVTSPTTNTGTTGQITKYPKLKRMAFGGTVKSAPRLAKIYKASKLRK